MLRRGYVQIALALCQMLAVSAAAAQFRGGAQPPVTASRAAPPIGAAGPYVRYVPTGEFQPLGSSSGWVVSNGDRLLWTTDDGAHWKDISPPNLRPDPFQWPHDTYADVFFLDKLRGWVLFSHQLDDDSDRDPVPHNVESDWTFYVVSTRDGGKSWTTTMISAMRDGKGNILDGRGEIAFGDGLHGWIVVSHSLSFADLLRTTDGGLHWEWVKNYPGLNASIGAVGGKALFVAGETSQGEEFDATWNGGRTFRRITLPAPASVLPANDPNYGTPVFPDERIGYETVTYSGGEDVHSAAVLFRTTDGGHRWNPDRILTNLNESDDQVSSAIAGASWIIPDEPYKGKLSLIRLPLTRGTTVAPANGIQDFSRCSVVFAGPERAWTACPYLSKTSDGGVTWKRITPREFVQTCILTTEPVNWPVKTPTGMAEIFTGPSQCGQRRFNR